MRQQEDWYAYLNLATDAPAEQIEQAVERLSRQATALAVTAPERSQRLRDTIRAIKGDLSSGPEAKARYDAGRSAASALPPPSATSSPAALPPPTKPPSAAAPSSLPMPPDPGAPAGGWPPGAAAPAAPGSAPGGERISSRIARFLRTGWTCAECGKEALPSDKFCTRCGAAILPTRHDGAVSVTRVACVNCGAPLGTNDAFCARCGTRVVKLTVTL